MTIASGREMADRKPSHKQIYSLALVLLFCVSYVWILNPSVFVLETSSSLAPTTPNVIQHRANNQSNITSEQILYPTWNIDKEELSIESILDFMHRVLNESSRVFGSRIFPERIYVVDKYGVWTSRTTLARSSSPRYRPTESVMMLAYHKLVSHANNDSSSQSWPLLQRQVLQRQDGFPMLQWYGDFRGCGYKNWKEKNISLPIFTVCAKVNCGYAFPFPNYRTVHDSKAKPEDWDADFDFARARFPWHNKTPSVVWRGSLSGGIRKYTSPRARIGLYAAAHANDTRFDIGLTSIPDNWRHEQVDTSRLAFKAAIDPMWNFQQHRAILDIDGNSWSSRFGLLLCYNSVILKVDPEYVDYFHYKYLRPWEHYIPVASDLSDLGDVGSYVNDPKNEQALRTIVANANDWCRSHMVYDAIATDMLDVWESYLGLLDASQSNWSQTWTAWRDRVFLPHFDMVLVRDPKDIREKNDPLLFQFFPK